MTAGSIHVTETKCIPIIDNDNVISSDNRVFSFGIVSIFVDYAEPSLN